MASRGTEWAAVRGREEAGMPWSRVQALQLGDAACAGV